MATLESLHIDNRFAALGEHYFSRVQPASLSSPRLVHFDDDAAALIDLDPAEARRPEFTEIFAGNRPLPGAADPIAMLYAGHQFGVYVPQLGDGRALLLAQVRNASGQSWDLQLKGAGQTPYSRHADGRAVLRSSIREYLCGSAMHHLGIPTTRALCVVASPDPVRRETVETAAIVCRMAPTHVRFGSFEVFYYREQFERLKPLADHVIAEHFPHLGAPPPRPSPVEDGGGRTAASGLIPPPSAGEGRDGGVYSQWLGEIIERTARLMAMWQAVGFCHGVMNTDNFSILGITLDYGPYGFMDGFDAHHICNHSDEGGRYAYDRQPLVGHWNCSRLLQATLPLLHEDPDAAVELATALLDRYGPAYSGEVTRRWSAKLGLREQRDGDPELINRFLTLLHQGRSDFTRSFRKLSSVSTQADTPPRLREEILALEAFDAWLPDYRARLRSEQSDDAERKARMDAVNPKYVLRNHLAQHAIERSQAGDDSEVDRLMRLLRKPFDEQPGLESYAAEPPASAAHIEVSCSS